ncbi:MAG: ATP-binding protein [Kovacikia sp.]
MASYPLSLIYRLGSFQAELLNQLLDWGKNLEQFNAELQQRVDRQEQELERQNQRLSESRGQSQQSYRHLMQMEKMAMLGQMVAGISHEINNPINFIYGNLPYVEEHVQGLLKVLQVYQEVYPGDAVAIQAVLEEVELDFLLEDLPRIVNSMKLGTDRIRELVLTLRNFYRLDEAEMATADLHEGIEGTLLLLQHRYKQGIEIIKEFGEIPPVECHINQINQVFMNLLSNAIDALEEAMVSDQWAMDDGRQESESMSQESATPQDPDQRRSPTIRIQTECLEKEHVRITISDNGPGIPLEAQAHLFEPFFTTKPMGVGTGLGLSISHQIVTETHGGQISCHSTLEGGTAFVVELPISQRG